MPIASLRGSPRSLLCSLLFIGALLAVAPAAAQKGPQAPDDGCLTESVCRAHYNHAVSLFEAGRFEMALPEFQAAYERRQMPWLLINIGRTLHRLGRPREALEYYERYKQAESKPDAETLERVERYITQAKTLADTTPVAPPVQPPPPPPEEKPLYKKWWFWTAIGGGVALVVIIGAAAGAASRGARSLPGDVMVYQPTF